MRYLYYYYEKDGTLIIKYSDDNGKRHHHRYVFYTLREALKQFRKEYNLRYKHLTIKKFY